MPITKLAKCVKAVSLTITPSLVKLHVRSTEHSGESQIGKFGTETPKEKIHNKADLGYICFKTKPDIYFIF